MAGRLETGIDVLDRKLEGGLPPGSVVAYTALPGSQSELLLYQLTAARGTLYLTTVRSDDAVMHAIESSQAPVGSPTVRFVGSENPIEEANRLITALPDGANLIIDTLNALERSSYHDFREFINGLKSHMMTTGSVAVLHCIKSESIPENRTITEQVADVVFDLVTEVNGSELENHLAVPKFRGGSALSQTVKLELNEQVAIDTSRDIA